MSCGSKFTGVGYESYYTLLITLGLPDRRQQLTVSSGRWPARTWHWQRPSSRVGIMSATSALQNSGNFRGLFFFLLLNLSLLLLVGWTGIFRGLKESKVMMIIARTLTFIDQGYVLLIPHRLASWNHNWKSRIQELKLDLEASLEVPLAVWLSTLAREHVKSSKEVKANLL